MDEITYILTNLSVLKYVGVRDDDVYVYGTDYNCKTNTPASATITNVQEIKNFVALKYPTINLVMEIHDNWVFLLVNKKEKNEKIR